jgi:hypothetical protein
MGRIAVLVAASAAALTLGAPPARAAVPKLPDEEAAFCAEELDVLERREAMFKAQGNSPSEIARRNEPQLRVLADCRERFRAEQRRAREQKQDLEEVQRRVGPDATEKERERAWREVRRERLASKPASQLTPEEKAELAAGMQDEMETTHAALDDAHARDPAFMRMVHSAMSCYHTDRKAELESQIASEQAHLKVGTGDRQRLYSLRSELHQSEEVLARTREATGGRGLEKCSSPSVAVIAHCMGLRFQGKRPEAACESEEIQQYVRFVK